MNSKVKTQFELIIQKMTIHNVPDNFWAQWLVESYHEPGRQRALLMNTTMPVPQTLALDMRIQINNGRLLLQLNFTYKQVCLNRGKTAVSSLDPVLAAFLTFLELPD